MARPIKNTADYFPHDTDMRNDPKIKALRRKYGIEGYGIYCMAIEYIGDSEHFVADISTLGLELMAGDFDCDPDKLIEVLKYCESIDLFQIESGDLTCKSLENRLSGLLSKRERDRGELSSVETIRNKVIASGSTQSKVKESKEEESESKEYGPTHKHFIIVKSKYLHQKTVRINGKAGLIEYMENNQTILNQPEHGEKFMRDANGKVFNELSHVQNAYKAFIKDQFK